VRVASRSGFTIVEAVIALVVLSVGILALVGSAALTSRMVGWGRHSTRVGQIASARIEWLQHVAASTVPPCTGVEWRSDSAVGSGFTEHWDILDAAGLARRARIILSTRYPTRTSSDTIVTGVRCGPP
jgi:Tfp pilus assembly protein PilV